MEHRSFDLCGVASGEELFLVCAKTALAMLTLQTKLEAETYSLVFHVQFAQIAEFRQTDEDLHSGGIFKSVKLDLHELPLPCLISSDKGIESSASKFQVLQGLWVEHLEDGLEDIFLHGESPPENPPALRIHRCND